MRKRESGRGGGGEEEREREGRRHGEEREREGGDGGDRGDRECLAGGTEVVLRTSSSPGRPKRLLPQNEKSELFCQPIPGMGLVYTGCPSGGEKIVVLKVP
jgi:hypothetical protein